jgi:hypothetical protein
VGTRAAVRRVRSAVKAEVVVGTAGHAAATIAPCFPSAFRTNNRLSLPRQRSIDLLTTINSEAM